MRTSRSFGLAMTILVLSLAFPVSALGDDKVPRLPASAADWAAFTSQERAAALAYEKSEFEAAAAAGTVNWTSGEATVSAASPDLVASVDAHCGLNWTNYPDGTWTYGWAEVTTSFSAYHIYAGEPPASTEDQFIRDGSVLQYFFAYSVGAGSSHEYAQSDPNFKWWFETPLYRIKSWMGVQRYQGGAWQLGPDAYCTYSARP